MADMNSLKDRLQLAVAAVVSQENQDIYGSINVLNTKLSKARYYINEILKDPNAKNLQCYEALKENFGG